MTFADGVLRLVRMGARIDSVDREASSMVAEPLSAPMADASREVALGFRQALEAGEDLEPAEAQPGLDDLEAAVNLVQAGLASRVVLAGFPSWPGLLWRAYRLAESADVLILPTVAHAGGKVDIVVTRGATVDG
ncbi:MAG: hypothetical protein ACXWN4_04035 [Candidatus Limnocylindrales bacterium]